MGLIIKTTSVISLALRGPTSRYIWIVATLVPQIGSGQEVVVSSSLPSQGFVDSRAEIRLSFDRPLEGGDGIAVFIDEEDVTSLFAWIDGTFAYQPGAFPLPAGRHALRVFTVSASGEWTQVARYDLRVRGALGFEDRDLRPGLELGLKSQPSSVYDPDESAPLRETYGDLDGELRLGFEQRHTTFTLTASTQVLGTSYRSNALRFQREGEKAPLVDLSSYSLGFQTDRGSLLVGHVRYGDHRHLTNGLSGRGASLGVSVSRVEASFATSSPNQIVGWDNLFGITEPEHRIVSGNLGLEVFETPGALRLDAGWMDGSVLPDGGFNQGVVNDAEKSTGYSFRLRANTLDRRVRLEAGYAESRFTNPEDSFLSQGFDLVPVERARNDAGYIDADIDVLRDLALGGSTKARLSIGYRHERVDPLYRSVGA